MSRGVGSLLLHYVMRGAHAAGVPLIAEMIPNDRNRMMFATYRLSGFAEAGQEGEVRLLRHDLAGIPEVPPYVRVEAASWTASQGSH